MTDSISDSTQNTPTALPRQMMIRFLEAVAEPGQVVEIRGLGSERSGTISGFFNDWEAVANEIARLDPQHPDGWFFTLNPVNPDLLARRTNRLATFAKKGSGATDADVIKRRWLLIDADATRPAGISATDEEKEAAQALSFALQTYLHDHGWPDPVVIDSGNGWHSLYRVDLPNDADSLALVSGALKALAVLFDTDAATIDRSVSNAARISKLPGTMVRKGDANDSRPWRRAKLIDSHDDVGIVSVEQLRVLAPVESDKPAGNVTPIGGRSASRTPSSGGINLGEFLSRHGIDAREAGPNKWQLAKCPFNESHKSPDSYVQQFDSGAVLFKCSHNSCSGNHWEDFQEVYEPGSMVERERKREAWEGRSVAVGRGAAVAVRPAESSMLSQISDAKGDSTDIAMRFSLAIGQADLAPIEADEAITALSSKTGKSKAVIAKQVKLASSPVKQGPVDSDLEQSEVAYRIAADIAGKWLWDSTGRAWFEFAGPHWVERDTDRFSSAVKVLVANIVGKFSAHFLAGVERLVKIDMADDAPWCDDRGVLPFKNGALNLVSLDLEPFGERRFCWCLPVEYDPAAKCTQYKKWTKFLSGNSKPDAEVLDCTLAAMLRGMYRLQVFFEITGQGGTGKGAFQHLACALVGNDNVVATDLANLGRNSFETARLYGKRLAVIGDADEFRGNMGTLKRLTGGDPIRLERKREDARSFIYGGMVMITGNQPVEGNDLSSGVFRRRVPLSFSRKPKQVDEKFYGVLTGELSGIITHLLRHDEPTIKRVLTAHQDGDVARGVLHSTNHMVAFVSDMLEQGVDADYVIIGDLERWPDTGKIMRVKTELYPAYVDWFEKDGGQQGGKLVNKRGFATKLVDACEMAKLAVVADKIWMNGVRGLGGVKGVRLLQS